MTSAFEKMKQSRKAAADEINKELERLSSKNKNATFEKEDDRFWRLTRDDAGNGQAIIRFLPAPEGETIPFVRLYSNAFQGPTGKWYIENNLNTLGKNDPVSEYNSELWNSGIESDKDQARKQKRKTTYISNILVIKDPANPENEGKTFLFKYGKRIFDKINALMHPEFDELEGTTPDPIIPYDLWEGCDFKLRCKIVDKYPNYDSSEFSEVTPVADSDEEIERIWASEHLLQPLIAPDQFKSYDELKSRLNYVLQLGDETSLPQRETTRSAPDVTTTTTTEEDDSSSVSFDDEDELESLVALASRE
jgi:hypothetical protein